MVRHDLYYLYLLNLYYYDQDRMSLRFVSTTQEIDRFAYYSSNHYTFYRDEMPDIMFVETGSALSMREKFLCGLDEHMVNYAPQGRFGVDGTLPRGRPRAGSA